MIQLKSIRIEEFRGIRELELALDCKSFVIVGPNGSGKSGVVDAIDFALTGNVARLSGAGTAGISVLKHGPHVDRRNDPASAVVALTLFDTETGQEGTLTRTVKTANKFTLDPCTPELMQAVAWAGKHPELILSRREVIKYVNAEPGKRAQEVQALLKLDRIDETRRLLRSALTKSSTTANAAASDLKASEDAVRRHLDVISLLTPEIVAIINRYRAVLGLDPLQTLTIDTDLSAGIVSDGGRASFNKRSAVRDAEALTDYLGDHEALSRSVVELLAALSELDADPTLVEALRHRELVELGAPLITGPSCPLCDQLWPSRAALEAHLAEKLERSERAAGIRADIQRSASRTAGELRRVRALIQAVLPHAGAVGNNDLQASLVGWTADISAREAKLATIDCVRQEADGLATDPFVAPAHVREDLRDLVVSLLAVPDQSASDAARTYLAVAQERWGRLRQARASSSKAAAAAKTAQAVYDSYNTVADEALEGLYSSVQNDFSNFYRRINEDDELAFKAELAPAAGRLDLAVDFYGLGMFPPMAYHSEGHQDGMGVCLYLALIVQLLKSDFRLAVLDDVVTSVDANHRRRFCDLLRESFPDVQFIMTTHEEVWARQMQSAGLVARQSMARFYGWTVHGGPHYEQGGDIWTLIDADLADDDVPGAAHKLRRSLEGSLADIAASLQGQVIFRPDNNYELGSFFASVRGRYGDLLKKAANSANSWNNDAAKELVELLKKKRGEAILAQEGENWAINALVHNNDWATFSKADFSPVVGACKQFVALFRCSNAGCDSWIYVVGAAGKEESLRCHCGSLNLNLRAK
ncbi:MAG: AAA family ATPase [Propionibacteriaceae bacterium]|nr:AAA family ATPase [Propionibacteriaceae bacterium]